MSKVRYFGDVHVTKKLGRALRVRELTMDYCRVGDRGAPPYDAPDLDLIRFAEAEHRILLTMDEGTMPGHVTEHQAAGGHTWGLFFLDGTASWRALIETLLLVWSDSEAEDWRDCIEHMPW